MGTGWLPGAPPGAPVSCIVGVADITSSVPAGHRAGERGSRSTVSRCQVGWFVPSSCARWWPRQLGQLACWGDRDVIVAAAVCPGAPFLIPGVAEPLVRESADLLAACTQAVRTLAHADRIVVIATGRRSIRYPA